MSGQFFEKVIAACSVGAQSCLIPGSIHRRRQSGSQDACRAYKGFRLDPCACTLGLALPDYGLCSNTESTMSAEDSPCLHAHNRISNSAILNNNQWWI